MSARGRSIPHAAVPDLTDHCPGPYCRARHEDGWVCTRLRGHTGRHAAGTGEWIRMVWGERYTPPVSDVPDTVTSVTDLRRLPVGTTLHLEGDDEDPFAGVVKVAQSVYATPSEYPGRVWSYYHEDEVAGLESDRTPEDVDLCSWFPLVVDDYPGSGR